MEKIWNTLLPWFHSKVVHIGADEYNDPDLSDHEFAQSYNYIVNSISAYISDESGKNMRIRGTHPPQSNYTDQIDRNTTIQHLKLFEDNPLLDYVSNGYNAINFNDSC